MSLNNIFKISNGILTSCDKEASGHIIIPDGVTEIQHLAFDECEFIESVDIPAGVTKIGYDAFTNCNSLVSISVSHENPVYDSRDNSNAIIETATNKLVATCKSTIIPAGVSE